MSKAIPDVPNISRISVHSDTMTPKADPTTINPIRINTTLKAMAARLRCSRRGSKGGFEGVSAVFSSFRLAVRGIVSVVFSIVVTC